MIAIPAITTVLVFPATKPTISGFSTAPTDDVFQRKDSTKFRILLSVFPAHHGASLA